MVEKCPTLSGVDGISASELYETLTVGEDYVEAVERHYGKYLDKATYGTLFNCTAVFSRFRLR